MGANSNGTPTSLGIPTLSPSQDNLNALGINEITNAIDAKIAGRMFAPLAPTDKQVVKWSTSGGAWIAAFVQPSELGQQAATTGQAMIWNGTQWGPGNVGAIFNKVTAKTVNTSIAATDLLNGECSIAAGIMGTTGKIRLTAWGDFLQNSGSNTPGCPQIQVVFGGTTLIDTGAHTGVGGSAVRNGWRIQVEICNIGATNIQTVSILYTVGLRNGMAGGTAVGANFVTGEGAGLGTGAPGTFMAQGWNSGALDTTTAKTLVLNTINASANAAYETVLKNATVELF